jgi:hypothetical protein
MFAPLPRPQIAAYCFGLGMLATCWWPIPRPIYSMSCDLLAASRKYRGASPRDFNEESKFRIAVSGYERKTNMRSLAILLLGLCVGSTFGQASREAEYYRLIALPIPEEIVLETGGIEPLPNGKLAVATRRGEIWLIENAFSDPPRDMKYSLFASGLHEVLGLFEKDGALYATQRCELTRVQDTNADGQADLFDTVSDGWSISGDYHEYAWGSPPDKEGNVWIALCLTGSSSSDVPYRGWCVRVTPDGKMIPTTSGIRSPGGIGFNAAGDVFFTENQGPWNGACSLKHLRPGGFVGHPDGNKWYSLTNAIGPRPSDPRSGSRMATEAKRIPELVPPAVYFPYQKMGQSAAGIACDVSSGKFGPFTNQLFIGDQSQSTVMRVFLEQVNGYYQGACFPFRAGFGSGSLAMRMTDDGSLLVGGTNRGWGSRGLLPYSLERLVWTGKIPFEIYEIHATPDGFDLSFTQPVDIETATDPKSYSLETYTYIYQSTYGSPEVDQTKPVIQRIERTNDRQVRLHIDRLQEGHVHEFHLDGVRSATGEPLLHREAYYTLNFIPAKE